MKGIEKRHAKPKGMRDVFAELTEGMAALAENREGKRALRSHAVEFRPAPTVTPRNSFTCAKSSTYRVLYLPLTCAPTFAPSEIGSTDGPNRMLEQRFSSAW